MQVTVRRPAPAKPRDGPHRPSIGWRDQARTTKGNFRIRGKLRPGQLLPGFFSPGQNRGRQNFSPPYSGKLTPEEGYGLQFLSRGHRTSSSAGPLWQSTPGAQLRTKPTRYARPTRVLRVAGDRCAPRNPEKILVIKPHQFRPAKTGPDGHSS